MPRLMSSQLATAAAGWRGAASPQSTPQADAQTPRPTATHARLPPQMPFPNTSTRAQGMIPNRRHQPLLLLARDQCGGGGWKHSTRLALCSRPPAWWSLSSPHPRGGHAPPPPTSTALADAITVIHPSLPATDPGHDGHGPQEEGKAEGGEVADCETLMTSSANCSTPLASTPPPAFRPTTVHPIRPVTEAASHQHGSRRPRRRPSAGRRVPNLGPRGYCEGTRMSGGRKGGQGEAAPAPLCGRSSSWQALATQPPPTSPLTPQWPGGGAPPSPPSTSVWPHP